MDYEPISVALKFAFLAILYLFLIWVVNSARKDLKRNRGDFQRLSMARFDLFGGATLGRSGQADISFEDRYASGLHARVYPRGDRYFVEDMNSTNGTLLNGASLVGENELADGYTISIGDTTFRFEMDGYL